MLFAFLISILGFAIAIRTSDELISRSLFSRSEMTKIGTAYIAMVCFALVVTSREWFSLWIAVFAPLTLLMISLGIIIRNRKLAFRMKFKEALSFLLLKMRSGKSFRLAFSELIAESEAHFRAKLSEISSVVAFSQQKVEISSDPFINEIVNEFIMIDRAPHSATRRVSLFRDKLRLEDDFRHRSGQVLARIRAQSLVMTGLFLAVLVFMIVKFGWTANSRTFTVSLFLFSLGALWIWLGGRRLKWKV